MKSKGVINFATCSAPRLRPSSSNNRSAGGKPLIFLLICHLVIICDGKSYAHIGGLSSSLGGRYSSLSSSSDGNALQQSAHHHHAHHQHDRHVAAATHVSSAGSSAENEPLKDLQMKSSTWDFLQTQHKGDSPMGCKELRSKRYISDGPCTSIKPITEIVCAGVCLPVSKLPWYSDYASLWSRPDEDGWQCVDDVIKRKRVHLQCQDGQQRSYVVRTVRSCKCKKRKRYTTNRTVSVKRKS